MICSWGLSKLIISLLIAAIVAGFLLGKSPNPMEGVVKVFKSMVGLYPDPIVNTIAFVFFIFIVSLSFSFLSFCFSNI